jgi:hypothetical protein
MSSGEQNAAPANVDDAHQDVSDIPPQQVRWVSRMRRKRLIRATKRSDRTKSPFPVG